MNYKSCITYTFLLMWICELMHFAYLINLSLFIRLSLTMHGHRVAQVRYESFPSPPLDIANIGRTPHKIKLYIAKLTLRKYFLLKLYQFCNIILKVSWWQFRLRKFLTILIYDNEGKKNVPYPTLYYCIHILHWLHERLLDYFCFIDIIHFIFAFLF